MPTVFLNALKWSPHIFPMPWRLLITHFSSCVTMFSQPSKGRVTFHAINTSFVACVSVLVPLCYHDYISATQASTSTTLPREAEKQRRCAVFLYVTVTWMSAAHITCPGPVSTLASVDKDKLQPSLTWQSSGLCKSLIWHSCLTLNGVFLLTWQPVSQCYDHR